MNGKYYGKQEIRWHSREKDRLEHIRNRKDENENTGRNRLDVGRGTRSGTDNVSFELLAGTSHRTADWS